MPRFEFLEETDELPYAAACVGLATYCTEYSVPLFERMWDTMTAREQIECNRLMDAMSNEMQR